MGKKEKSTANDSIGKKPETIDVLENVQADNESDGFYVLPDEEESDDGVSPQPGDGGNALRLFAEIMLHPVEGWKKLRRSRLKNEDMARGVFYPALAMYAASQFADMWYLSGSTLQQTLITGLIKFISYFLGYFLIMAVVKSIVPSESRKCFDSDFGKCLIMIALTTLVVCGFLINLLPMLQPVLVFMPLYTIYIITRGVKYLRAPERYNTLLAVELSVLSIGVPVLLQWLCGMMIPD